MKKEYLGLVDITNEEYHSSAGISRSGIMEFKKAPKKYWHRYLNPNYVRKKSTPEMDFGTAFHAYILEPELFKKEFHLFKKINRQSAAGKAAYADMMIESENKILIDEEQKIMLDRMKSVLMDDPEAKELIVGAQYEKSIYWVDPDTKLLCKVRPDIWHKNFVVDLKTTKDASFYAFQRDFYNSGYHIQLGMIQEALKHALGIDMRNFIDLPIEKEEPYCHNIYPLDEAAIEEGVREFKYQLMSLKQCMDKNYWPSYLPKTMTLPKYAMKGE